MFEMAAPPMHTLSARIKLFGKPFVLATNRLADLFFDKNNGVFVERLLPVFTPFGVPLVVVDIHRVDDLRRIETGKDVGEGYSTREDSKFTFCGHRHPLDGFPTHCPNTERHGKFSGHVAQDFFRVEQGDEGEKPSADDIINLDVSLTVDLYFFANEGNDIRLFARGIGWFL